MSNLKKKEINFDLLYRSVQEMVGYNSPSKIESLMVYLLEEISYARHQWEECLKTKNWYLASRILHREKVFINFLDIFNDPEKILKIQNRPQDFKPNELKSFYTEMVELFKRFELMISQNNGISPA